MLNWKSSSGVAPVPIEQAVGQSGGAVRPGLARGLHEAVDVLVEQAEREQRFLVEVPLEVQVGGLGAEGFQEGVAAGDRAVAAADR
jgi:hypothetical protein